LALRPKTTLPTVPGLVTARTRTLLRPNSARLMVASPVTDMRAAFVVGFSSSKRVMLAAYEDVGEGVGASEMEDEKLMVSNLLKLCASQISVS